MAACRANTLKIGQFAVQFANNQQRCDEFAFDG